MSVFELEPKSLKPNSFNSNQVSSENMQKLKNSITDLGFSTAVVVRTLPDGEYEILGGEHRVKAAIELGLRKIPVLNVGEISDRKARKIALVDNQRFGNDDAIALAKVIEEIGEDASHLASFMPISEADIVSVLGSVEIDLDSIGMEEEDETVDDSEDLVSERAIRTHDVLKFRVGMSDAEAIRRIVEKTIRREGVSDSDEMTAAGSALAILILGAKDE